MSLKTQSTSSLAALRIAFTLLMATIVRTPLFAQYGKNAVAKDSIAPNIIAPDTSGKELRLSVLNEGKYLLLDFWASWCGPCRTLTPRFKQLQLDFADKKFQNAPGGFTIVGFSSDNDKSKWHNAIATDSLYWPQFSDLKGVKSEIAYRYGIIGWPTFFLISPSGKILGRYDSPSDIEKIEAELTSQLIR